MSKVIQAIRGMNDLLPETLGVWQRIEEVASRVLASYGYREIRFPLLERTELYVRSIGRVTDIVEKEMYTFEDRNGDSLTLRPEGTAGCVRAGIENGLLHNQVQRLWYAGPMFRHERPQKGRYRQFHQFGVEAFGLAGPDIDAELVGMNARLWDALGVKDDLELQVNSLGTPESRAIYRKVLVEYLSANREALDDDSLRRLDTNPLRILDSKNPDMQPVIRGAPRMMEYLDDASRDHFERLCAYLDAMGLRYEVNPALVRGLDYYTRTVFEWISSSIGAQGTVSAGGRYDGLVEQLGGRATPAAGFALGMERLVELVARHGVADDDHAPQVYIAVLDAAVEMRAIQLAEALRDRGHRIQLHCGGGSLKSQMKKADQSRARYVLMLGSATDGEPRIEAKNLRQDEPQRLLSWQEVDAYLGERLH